MSRYSTSRGRSVPLARLVGAAERLAFHGRDIYGTGLAKAFAAIDVGMRTIDSSVGGLSGCPIDGPRALVNLATEDLVYALGSDETNIDLNRLVETAWWICPELGDAPAPSATTAMSRGESDDSADGQLA